MSDFNQQFLMSLIIISIGYLLKRTGLIWGKDGEGFARLVFNLTLPSLIIYSLNDLVFNLSHIALVFGGILYGMILTSVALIFFKHHPKQMKGMLVMMLPGLNIGLFAYPLVEGLFGQDGVNAFGMLDVGNALIVFGVCYLLGQYYAENDQSVTIIMSLKKLVRSVPLLTYLTMFAISVLGLSLPSLVIDVAYTISRANMPLSLLLLGVYLFIKLEKADVKYLLRFISLRYGIAIPLSILLYTYLPFEQMVNLTLSMGVLLPLPLTHIPYGVEFNYDKRFIGTVSSLSLLISFVILWIYVQLI